MAEWNISDDEIVGNEKLNTDISDVDLEEQLDALDAKDVLKTVSSAEFIPPTTINTSVLKPKPMTEEEYEKLISTTTIIKFLDKQDNQPYLQKYRGKRTFKKTATEADLQTLARYCDTVVSGSVKDTMKDINYRKQIREIEIPKLLDKCLQLQGGKPIRTKRIIKRITKRYRKYLFK